MAAFSPTGIGACRRRLCTVLIALVAALFLAVPASRAESSGWLMAGDLRDAKIWQSAEYRALWTSVESDAAGPQSRLRPVEISPLFGLTPESAAARLVGDRIDSLSVLKLISRLEGLLNMSIPAAELQPDDFESIDIMVDTVERVGIAR